MYGCIYHKEDGFCEKFSDDRCKSYCVMGPCQYAIPSNADRIRAMSDEELANFIGYACQDAFAYGAGLRNRMLIYPFGTREETMDWLKAPV